MANEKPDLVPANQSMVELTPAAEGFKEKVTPKEPGDNLFMFSCPTKETEDGPECGGIHYRHAGYVQVLLPYIEPPKEKKMIRENHNVMVCVKCKHSYIWVSSQMYDVTNRIDLNAWEKLESQMYKATGPGGDC